MAHGLCLSVCDMFYFVYSHGIRALTASVDIISGVHAGVAGESHSETFTFHNVKLCFSD